MEHVERLVAEALLLLEATELVDEKAMALTLRAATHRFFGRRQDAQRDLTQATTLAPNSWQPRFHLVALLLDDEKASEALFVLEGAASLDSDATLLSLKGTALVALHRPTEAEGTFRDALRLALGTDDEMDVRLAGAVPGSGLGARLARAFPGFQSCSELLHPISWFDTSSNYTNSSMIVKLP